MTLALPPTTRRRKPSLTAMIDVVFLLLVFFMLAARFGLTDATRLSAPGAGDYIGPPRLITLTPDQILLNGTTTRPEDLPAALADLMRDPGDMILIRPTDGASVQDLLDLMTNLNGAGLSTLGVLD